MECGGRIVDALRYSVVRKIEIEYLKNACRDGGWCEVPVAIR